MNTGFFGLPLFSPMIPIALKILISSTNIWPTAVRSATTMSVVSENTIPVKTTRVRE